MVVQTRSVEGGGSNPPTMEELMRQIVEMGQNIKDLQERLNNGEGTSQNGGQRHGNQQLFHRVTKVEFPKFGGDDVRGWLFKCEQFFKIDNIPEQGKVNLVSIHLFDLALMWHRQFVKFMGEDVEWNVYKGAILKRFGTVYDDPLSEIKKLKQTGNVQDYIDAFDKLMCRIELEDEQCMSFFMAGLSSEIELSVRMFRPRSLYEVYGLSKLEEARLNVLKQKQRTPILPTPKPFNHLPNTGPRPMALPAPNVNWRNKTASNNQIVPFRRQLSQKELEEKRAKNQCFYCDQRYTPGHKCSGQMYSLEVLGESENEVLEEEENVQLYEVETEETGEVIEYAPQILLNAINGTNSYQTMRICGHVGKHKLHILIDCGSTHNFLDINTAKKLGCNLIRTCPLQIDVPGGNQLISQYNCKRFTWQLQGENFVSDVMTIPLGGCEMVLGIQWLSTLGDMLCNFLDLKMEFMYHGKKVVLRGTKKASLQWMKGSKMHIQTPCAELSYMALCLYPTASLNMVSMSDIVEVPKEISLLIDKYPDVFAIPTTLPPQRSFDHKIPLKEGTMPINSKPYRHPLTQKDSIEVMVKELLETGVIRDSQSPFSSPVVMVKKKDGTWRMCIDYRQLNNATIKDKFPIPVIEELINELQGSQYFTKLDLRSGYHQIRMHHDDVEKTAFKTHEGHYEFLVMPFGLTNAPSTFQALMNSVFKEYLRKFVLVFFDDILVYNPILSSHVEHLELVLQVLRINTLYAKQSKCAFGAEKVEYLGHVITREGVSTDHSKIEAMQSWPQPTNIKQLRGFLGLTGYYRRFVKGYALISQPLTKLLKKNSFKWSTEAQAAFERLKQAMVQAPVLKLPNFNEIFTIETDASLEGIGAVLQQGGHPVAYFSKTLAPRHHTLSTYEKELLASNSSR
jgi:hypothetical protein